MNFLNCVRLIIHTFYLVVKKIGQVKEKDAQVTGAV